MKVPNTNRNIDSNRFTPAMNLGFMASTKGQVIGSVIEGFGSFVENEFKEKPTSKNVDQKETRPSQPQ